MWAAGCQSELLEGDETLMLSSQPKLPLTASSSSSVPSPLWRKAHTYHIVITTNFRLVISPANIIIHGSLHHWVLFSVLFESNHGAHYHQKSMVWVLLPFVEKEEDLGE